MITKNTRPNEQQKQWLERVTRYAQDHGSFPLREIGGNFQRHHVVGRSGKNNKVAIGHWFVLPIATDYHDVTSNNKLNVTHYRKAYSEQFGAQRDQWLEMIEIIEHEDDGLPFGRDVIAAVMTTRY